ncbi:MAG: phosphoribosylanthranilate isomerase [Ruminococcus sp.]|nr:phosphoribosylanthranilate isomerase [Ruminococcus sp.]
MSDTKIKICGLTRDEDITILNNTPEVDWGGFVLFYPKSRRNVEFDEAARLGRQLRGIEAIAVTVSPTPEQARKISHEGFGYIQIHGELPEMTYRACYIPVIRAFNSFDPAELERCAKLDRIEYFLFDAAEPGSGKPFDWSVLSALPDYGKKIILAGGLTPDNVAAAINAIHPDRVDVSTGVEFPGGGKDPELVKKFCEAVKNA